MGVEARKGCKEKAGDRHENELEGHEHGSPERKVFGTGWFIKSFDEKHYKKKDEGDS